MLHLSSRGKISLETIPNMISINNVILFVFQKTSFICFYKQSWKDKSRDNTEYDPIYYLFLAVPFCQKERLMWLYSYLKRLPSYASLSSRGKISLETIPNMIPFTLYSWQYQFVCFDLVKQSVLETDFSYRLSCRGSLWCFL